MENKESQPSKTIAPVAVKTRSHSHLSPLLVVSLILSGGALAYSLWNAVQMKQTVALQERQLTQTHEEQTQLSRSLEQQDRHLKTLVDNLKTTQDMQGKQQELLTTYANSLQKIVNKTGVEKTDLQLDEVLFLVRQARLHLIWRRDLTSAIGLLQLADDQLQKAAHPEWVSIRTQLAKDLASLKAVNLPDRDGILAKLSALSQSMNKLPFAGGEGAHLLMPAESAESSKLANEVTLPAWKKAWLSSLDVMKKAVVIRRREAPVEPILSPEDIQMVSARLKLALEGAEFGVIQQDGSVYRNSLTQASTWVKTYFDPNASSTQAFVQELEALSAIDLTPELPDITPTQVLIEKMIDQRTQHKESE